MLDFLAPYGRVTRISGLPAVIVLGLVLRIPLFAAGIVLTLHVVNTLGASWTMAGVAATAATLAGAVSSPYRGRLLDRAGLRRTVVPCLVVTAICWSIAPFVGYLPLVVLTVLAGLFLVPTFTIGRQAIIALVPESELQTALSLDSVGVETAYMIGPLLGVWAATTFPTSWCLLVFQLTSVLAGIALLVVDPPLRAKDHEDAPAQPLRAWISPAFVAIVAAACAGSIVLSGTEIGIVAFLKDLHRPGDTGWVLALWGLGSLLGGVVYGGLSRGFGPFTLLGALSLVTIPAVFSQGVHSLAALVTVAGVLCAPTIAASAAAISRVVPPAAIGEAMGWQGSAMTVGSALGAPLVGVVIDAISPRASFAAVGVLGLAVAVLGAAVTRLRRRRAAAA